MRTLVFFTALLLGTNEKRIWELQSIIQSKAVFIWIIYWLKPGLKKSIPSWLLKSLSVLFVVRMKQFCSKSGALNLIPSKTVYSAFSLPYSWHLKLYSCFFYSVLFSSQLQPMRAETVLCNKVFNILLRIVCQPCCLPRQSIFQPGLHLGGAHHLPNNQISSGRPKDKVLSRWGQIGPGVVL